MAKINHIIGPRVHEIIRTKVAQILALELANQAILTYDDDFALPIFVHRFKPVMPDELPIAIVSTNSGSFDNMDIQKSDGKFPIYIDVYNESFSSSVNRADSLSSFGAHKIAGCIMGILESPVYLTLDFAPGTIKRTYVESFDGGEMDRQDGASITVVRVVLMVEAVQVEALQDAIPFAGNNTTVNLGSSEKGYFYEFNSES